MTKIKAQIAQNGTPKGWRQFILWGTILFVFTIWVGNLWLNVLMPLLFDIYVSKYVHWNWKERKDGKKVHWLLEWLDAIVFALVAVALINNYVFQNYKIPSSSLEESLLVGDRLFVSKMAFGPRNPMTPLSFPLAQHTMPITKTKSYFDKPQWNYKRLKGFGHVVNDDIVVFNFPTGDTVMTNMPNPDFYTLCRMYGRENVINNSLSNNGQPLDLGEMVVRPIDRRENYVKRCVAIPGDEFSMLNGQVFINGTAQQDIRTLQHGYHVKTSGRLNPLVLRELGITSEDLSSAGNSHTIKMTEDTAAKLRAFSVVTSVIKDIEPVGYYASEVFPHSPSYVWNRDNYGPLHIPAAGEIVALNSTNLPIYERIISVYEGNELQVKGSEIFINGEVATDYTFKQDYYFMLGDNRHNSVDSRFWGFVPEDHVVGRPVFVWLSLDEERSFPANIRFKRFFHWVPKQ